MGNSLLSFVFKNFDLKSLKRLRCFYAHPKADIKPNIAYHGSPRDFDVFDVSKIGTGEGCSKRGKGLYLFRTKKFAPFFANIKSPDAPPHLGRSTKLENPNPTIYTVCNLKNLNLKQVSLLESKQIARNQQEFEKLNPHIDGIELPSTEICVFPKSVEKLSILQKSSLLDFVKINRDYPFREWTIDKVKLEQVAKNIC